MMSKRDMMLYDLDMMTKAMGEFGFVITESMLMSLTKKLQIPGASRIIIAEEVGYVLNTFMEEIGRLYPRHHIVLSKFAGEFGSIVVRKPATVRRDIWSYLEDRGTLEGLGNKILQRASGEKDPITRTLLLCLNLVAMYETGKTNFQNFAKSIFARHEGGLDDSGRIVQLALTLSPEHLKRKHGAGVNPMCEMYHIRNGIAHYRFEVADDGALKIWDINEKKHDRVRSFEETFSYDELREIHDQFLLRINFLDAIAYLITLKGLFDGPNASDYLPG